MIGLAALLSWTTTLIPYLIPAVIIAIGGNRRGSPAVWFLAGVGFAFTTAAIWHGTPGRPLVGAALFIVGSLVADAIWIVVAVPTRAGVIKLATRAGIVMPALTRYRRPRAAHADPLMQPAECLRRVRPLVRRSRLLARRDRERGCCDDPRALNGLRDARAAGARQL